MNKKRCFPWVIAETAILAFDHLLCITRNTPFRYWSYKIKGKRKKFMSKEKWFIHTECEIEDRQNYTITTNPSLPGWCTDSGCEGYGLPKQVATFIVEVLNFLNANSMWETTIGSWRLKKTIPECLNQNMVSMKPELLAKDQEIELLKNQIKKNIARSGLCTLDLILELERSKLDSYRIVEKMKEFMLEMAKTDPEEGFLAQQVYDGSILQGQEYIEKFKKNIESYLNEPLT